VSGAAIFRDMAATFSVSFMLFIPNALANTAPRRGMVDNGAIECNSNFNHSPSDTGR
jgi:hypothetical protein